MDTREPYERLVEARERAGYATATDAARAFGWNENTYRSHENGERGLRRNVALKYAAALRTTASWLLTGEATRSNFSINFEPVAGYVDDDGVVIDYPNKGHNGYEAHTASTFFENYLHFTMFEVVLSRPFMKFSNGDLIFVMVDSSRISQSAGTYAIIELEDGRSVLRIVRPGFQEGTVDIQANPESPSVSVIPKGIFQVTAIIPRGMWRKSSFKEWHDDLAASRKRLGFDR